MALPVIANTFRVTVDFNTVSGLTPRCVHHVQTATADVEEVGDIWWEAAPDGLYGPMLGAHEPTSISIIPLDGIGATAIVPRPGGASTLCLGTGQSMPQVAAVVSLRSNVRGPRGRGRQYVGPLVEQAQDQGVMDASTRGNLRDAWNDFQVALLASDPAATLVVASYVHAEANDVMHIDVDTLTGTQRRRQDQLR